VTNAEVVRTAAEMYFERFVKSSLNDAELQLRLPTLEQVGDLETDSSRWRAITCRGPAPASPTR
jgi:hypothetical protein